MAAVTGTTGIFARVVINVAIGVAIHVAIYCDMDSDINSDTNSDTNDYLFAVPMSRALGAPGRAKVLPWARQGAP